MGESSHHTPPLTVTILGCGSSGGVPRPGTGWGACDPANPRNRRRRCSLLVERVQPHGRTSVLIDTSPDLREQLLGADVRHLDGVLMTHDHADHTHGIDDLRPLVIHMRRIIDIHADQRTAATLMQRFGYIFEAPPGSSYPPIATLWRIEPDRAVTIDGAGGSIAAEALEVEHGEGYAALGLRFGAFAYLPDVSRIPDKALSRLGGLDLLILDALRYTAHPTHFSVSDALAAIAQLKPRRAILTNLHIDLDFDKLSKEMPENVEIAFDSMRLTV